MTKYLLKRILHGLISIIIVVMAVMLLVYNCIDKNKVINQDPNLQKKKVNQKISYKYEQWEKYGYLDYITYQEWLNDLVANGEITEEQKAEAVKIGDTSKKDSPFVAEYISKFTDYYKSKGYTVERVDTRFKGSANTTNYTTWLTDKLLKDKNFLGTFKEEALNLGKTPEEDGVVAAEYVSEFTKLYESYGYTVERNGDSVTAKANDTDLKQAVKYTEWLDKLVQKGELSKEDREEAATLGETAKKDNASAAKYIAEFTSAYEEKGYKVDRGEGDLTATQINDYKDWLNYYVDSGKYKEGFKELAKDFGQVAEDDTAFAAKYVNQFYDYYTNLGGYSLERRAASLQANSETVYYKDWINQYFEEHAEEIEEEVDLFESDADTYEKKLDEYKKAVAKIANTAEEDDDIVAVYVARFKEYYEEQGYTVERWDWDKEYSASKEVVKYEDWLDGLVASGELSAEDREQAALIGKKVDGENQIAADYIAKFKADHNNEQGYRIVSKDTVLRARKVEKLDGGDPLLFAYQNKSIWSRMWNYFTGVIRIDNIHYANNVEGDRGIKFTLFDPAYDGKFSPAIMGNGTKYKYLLYFDDRFPFIHQNLVKIQLGLSYTINQGVDVWDTMVKPQGKKIAKDVIYPDTKYKENIMADIHSLQYQENSFNKNDEDQAKKFIDDYTYMEKPKEGLSKMAYSFIIGVIASIISYIIGIPLGLLMSRYQNKLVDKIGTAYIIFIIAVPSLAYIFMFRAIGLSMGLPITFDYAVLASFILPIVSIALKEIGGLMRWSRRYMIDQKNADYVKFARSGGLSEGEIFRKHILKNAMVIIVHGVPGTILAALVGAIVTERVYSVPGTGGMLVNAISAYDNSAIVGLAMFYALLSVTSIILGDVFMAMIDPRISFTSKGRR